MRTLRRPLTELALVLGLYVAYSFSRTLANGARTPALERAVRLHTLQEAVGLDWELPLNRLFAADRWVGLVGSYWYATAHYAVTAAVLIWLFHRGPAFYLPARRALVLLTVVGLVIYLWIPTAPPRFLDGFTDVLAINANDGWWGGDASAPRGLGAMTNQLAALPSLHAGWSLWVALALQRHSGHFWTKVLGWTYALGTAVVVIGTGNHWVTDVVLGWFLVLVAWAVVGVMQGMVSKSSRRPGRLPADLLTDAH